MHAHETVVDASIDSAAQLTLSQPATTTGEAALTFTGLGPTVQTQQGTLQKGFATITGLDTSGLSTGMSVVGVGVVVVWVAAFGSSFGSPGASVTLSTLVSVASVGCR